MGREIGLYKTKFLTEIIDIEKLKNVPKEDTLNFLAEVAQAMGTSREEEYMNLLRDIVRCVDFWLMDNEKAKKEFDKVHNPVAFDAMYEMTKRLMKDRTGENNPLVTPTPVIEKDKEFAEILKVVKTPLSLQQVQQVPVGDYLRVQMVDGSDKGDISNQWVARKDVRGLYCVEHLGGLELALPYEDYDKLWVAYEIIKEVIE